jgi:hypothetical protein
MPNTDYIQNPEHIVRAKTYQTRAMAMFDAGFTSEAARKDAIDFLNRAYDILVKEGINYALWSQRTRGETSWIWDNETAENLYVKHNVPDLHVWAPKHAALYAAYPAQVKFASVLRADRDAIKAVALVARPKSKTRELAEARNAVAKTCQICGRPILAETGKIAHHGYQRPGHGWQTASCYGARQLPFEISRGALGTYIKLIQGQLEALEIKLGEVKGEHRAIQVNYNTGRYNGRFPITGTFYATRDTYIASRDEHRKLAYHWSSIAEKFDDVKDAEVRSIERQIRETKRYILEQQARYDAWKAVV